MSLSPKMEWKAILNDSPAKKLRQTTYDASLSPTARYRNPRVPPDGDAGMGGFRGAADMQLHRACRCNDGRLQIDLNLLDPATAGFPETVPHSWDIAGCVARQRDVREITLRASPAPDEKDCPPPDVAGRGRMASASSMPKTVGQLRRVLCYDPEGSRLTFGAVSGGRSRSNSTSCSPSKSSRYSGGGSVVEDAEALGNVLPDDVVILPSTSSSPSSSSRSPSKSNHASSNTAALASCKRKNKPQKARLLAIARAAEMQRDFAPVPTAGPSDWNSLHDEEGQTVQEFAERLLNRRGPRPAASRTTHSSERRGSGVHAGIGALGSGGVQASGGNGNVIYLLPCGSLDAAAQIRKIGSWLTPASCAQAATKVRLRGATSIGDAGGLSSRGVNGMNSSAGAGLEGSPQRGRAGGTGSGGSSSLNTCGVLTTDDRERVASTVANIMETSNRARTLSPPCKPLRKKAISSSVSPKKKNLLGTPMVASAGKAGSLASKMSSALRMNLQPPRDQPTQNGGFGSSVSSSSAVRTSLSMSPTKSSALQNKSSQAAANEQFESLLTALRDYCAAFFEGCDVRLLPYQRFKDVSTRPGSASHRQLHAGELLKQYLIPLKKRQFPDSYALMGITFEDLYPCDDWPFVSGLSDTLNRVGVCSGGRYFIECTSGSRGGNIAAGCGALEELDLFVQCYASAKLLKRMCRVLTHELCHCFQMKHCVDFNCLMQGSKNFSEAEAKALDLCPVCLTKLYLMIEMDCTVRYRRMRDWGLHWACVACGSGRAVGAKMSSAASGNMHKTSTSALKSSAASSKSYSAAPATNGMISTAMEYLDTADGNEANDFEVKCQLLSEYEEQNGTIADSCTNPFLLVLGKYIYWCHRRVAAIDGAAGV
ncbi:unnamed protein product [Amoebophrya sp. A25]|nr:unnamed protein product [Amoebophrya sp. A25]|eukprot:GSA25T00002711001.1